MNEIISNLPWIIGAGILIWLTVVLIKKLFAIGVMLVIAAVVIFLMYGGTSDPKAVPDFIQQFVGVSKRIVSNMVETGKMVEFSKVVEASTITPIINSDPIIDSAPIVATHNKWRSWVGVPVLRWSDSLASDAQVWANSLKDEGCAMAHSPQQKHGENISRAGWPSGDTETQERIWKDIPWEEIVFDWASEANDYRYETNTCVGPKCGHYTQIVWKTTEEVGCATAICDDKSQVWVCRYNPPGNYKGERPY